MDAKTRKQLERAGFAVGTAAEFLALAPEEAALVEMRLALSRALRERRNEAGLTQAALARLTGSSQSRVAKMEAGDPSVRISAMSISRFARRRSRGSRDVDQPVRSMPISRFARCRSGRGGRHERRGGGVRTA